VKPVGWWRKAAIANNEESDIPLIRFRRDVILVATGSASLLFMLVGIGRLLVGAPGESILVSLLFVATAIAAIPFWWSAIVKQDAVDRHDV
jgi:hypothetical protein